MRLRAFTLIELLIVVAIIGILAAIAVPNFMNARIKAAVARCQADMKAATNALEMYRMDNGKYIKTYGGASELFQLTTPMAYLSSVPPDYFISQHQTGKNFNSDSTSNSWDYSGNDLGWNSKPPHAYMLSSIGPAQTGHGPHPEWYMKGPNNWNNLIFRDSSYMPSNGIKSAGAIMQFGGDKRPVW
ncbi:MAG TPA: prepilin-type N-terminal cleavage/methylation domain-containing protein [bacterium]|nr:prepilin-type N-terminal cleavage/methylation domain-containing protein [bacterium]HQQ00337.1 prepilin-type N-terminal cleavage/methylation domain-containing protein [bacterium]